MPICYEIEIEIERGPDDPKPGTARIKTKITKEEQINQEQLEIEIDKFLKKLKKTLFDYDRGDRVGELRDYNILGIFPC